MLLHRIGEIISRNTRIIILNPYLATLGNCAETIYFGLLRARREGKKLLMLSPHQLPWKLHYRVANPELLNIQSDYRWVDKNNLATHVGKLFLTLIYTPLRIFTLSLVKFFNIHLSPIYARPTIGLGTLWQPLEKMDQFSWEIVDAYHWKEQFNDPLPVYLEKSRRLKAEKVRDEMGLARNSWFVCLHIREGGYYNDYKTECRNATISNYIPAIREITSRGGWVIRMGDPTMTPLPPMERVIDYPHTVFKSRLMDVYLISVCRFFIGVSSGLTDVAVLFQKPQILTNLPLWIHGFPFFKGDLAILKHLYSKSRGRFLSLREVLEGGMNCQFLYGIGEDFIPYENSPEEIRDVVLEFLEKPDNGQLTPLQKEFHHQRILQGRKILSIDKFVCPSNRRDDIEARYRFASRLESCQGAIGRRFIEQNWDQSSRFL